MEATIGSNIKGYEIQERIGAGGFGAVYRAHQTTVGREVVIKCILPSLANRPEFIRRFETEAQLVARLEHLHIVPLYDYWRDADGAYLVMRYLRGGSLRDTLVKGAYDLESAVTMVDQISSGLTTAHRNSVIHRDLKPANILLDEDGNAYLADFGIAKNIGLTDSSVTEPDQLIGSPDYLAPEQARGEAVTPQTDIYSLGILLYEILTGQHPFPGLKPVERLFKHLNEPVPAITSLDSALADEVNAVIHRATAKNPAQRYADILEMAAAFRQAAALSESNAGDRLVALLTPREQDILKLIIEGKSNREIAQALVVELGTVKWYINQIYQKLNVRSRVQAIVRARELNLIVADRFTEPATTFGLLPEPKNPYKGLFPFEAADEQDFFGREKLTKKLLKRLAEKDILSRFLAIVGPSGSGKSSVVKAGLIPALWRGEMSGSEKWFIVEMIPGARPMDELEIALLRIASNQTLDLRAQLARDEHGLIRAAQLLLPDDGSDLLLVIDQFEEVFTLGEKEEERLHFLNLIHRAVTDPRSRVRVVVTMRADFYDRPLQYENVGELVRSRMETILPLSAEEIERAIRQPAERIGISFEEGLISTIISDVHYQPGGLPLLQYALTELFECRAGRTLTHEAYQRIGGAVGALAKRAEEVYGELSETGQEAVRQLFMRLVTPGEGTEDARRRVSRAELLSMADDPDRMDEIIDTFASYRLLSLDRDLASREPTVEVAHEALLREWERLRLWLNNSRDDIKLQRQLSSLAAEWQHARQEASFLLRGARLNTFEKWIAETQLALTPHEHDYLSSSSRARQHEREKEISQQARERSLEKRSRDFMRGLVVVFATSTVIAIGLSIFAFNKNQIALAALDKEQIERERAENHARIAQARELVGYANHMLDSDSELSTLLALQAVNITYSADGTVLPEAETVLHQAVQKLNSPLRLEIDRLPTGEMPILSFSSDGTRIFYPISYPTATTQVRTGVSDVIAGQLLYTLPGGIVSDVSTINQMLTFDSSGQLLFWDVGSSADAQQLAAVPVPFSLAGATWLEADAAFQHIAITDGQGSNRVWNLTTGEEITNRINPPLSTGPGHPGFTLDGMYLALVNQDGSLSIVDTRTWQELHHFSIAGSSIKTFKFSQDSLKIAIGNNDETITLWDIASGQERFTFASEINPFLIAINADGTRIAVTNKAGTVAIWDTSSQRELLRLSVSSVDAIALSADGTRLATLHNRGEVYIWNLVPDREVLTVISSTTPPGDGGTGLDYSPDGSQFVTASSATPIVWDAQTGQAILTLTGHAERVWTADWSSDGTLIATAGEDTEVKLWDAASGEELRTFSGHTNTIYSVAFSPDSTRLASSSLDQTVRIWDVATGELLLILDQPAPSKGVAWSPDGSEVASATNATGDGHSYLSVWNSQTGERRLEIPLTRSGSGIVRFSPDGTQIAIGMTDAHAGYIVDAQTGEKLLVLEGHISNVAGVAYSSDGTLIATAGLDADRQIKLWDTHTGELALTLSIESTGISRVAFSPDGKHLASLNLDGTARIYFWRLEDLIVLAESRLTRWWTPEECQQYLHTDTCPTKSAGQ